MQNTKLSTKQARGERNERTAGSAGPDIGAAPDRVRSRGEGLRIGVRPGGGGAAGGVHLPQGGGLLAHHPGVRGAHRHLGGGGGGGHQRAAGPPAPGGGRPGSGCDVRRRRGQPGGISGLLLPLLLCRLGGAGPGHALGGGTVDSLLRPAGGDHLQHQTGGPGADHRLAGSVLSGMAGAHRLLRSQCVRTGIRTRP